MDGVSQALVAGAGANSGLHVCGMCRGLRVLGFRGQHTHELGVRPCPGRFALWGIRVNGPNRGVVRVFRASGLRPVVRV